MRRASIVVVLIGLIVAMGGGLVSPQAASAATYTYEFPATTYPALATIVLAGETVTVSATGIVTWGDDSPDITPDGCCGDAGGGFMAPGVPLMSLLGRVDGGDWFFVGSGPLEISGTGLLEFGINDYAAAGSCDPEPNCFPDNTGSFTITIVGPDPEPDALVAVHVRDCPAGAEQAFTDCHPFGIPDAEVSLINAADPTIVASGMTDADGNIMLDGFAGGWLLSVDPGDGYIPVSAYCSYEENIGEETFIDLSAPITVESGDAIVCDVYFTGGADNSGGDEGSGGDNGGVALPDTGSGPSGSQFAGELALMISAIAAGAAIARRRRQERA